MSEKPVWVEEMTNYLTSRHVGDIRFTDMPESFKKVHFEDEVTAASALVILWVKLSGAKSYDEDAANEHTKGMIVALGIERAASAIKIDLSQRGWPVTERLNKISEGLRDAV